MAKFLPFVMQQILNRPIACSAAMGDMIAAALSGRINISDLEDSGGRVRNRADLEMMARQGRLDADERRDMSGSAQVADYQGGGKTFLQYGGIAVIQVWGTLTRTWGVGPYSGSTGYDGIQIQLIDAMEDKSVKAIWLDINSGGGQVSGLFDLCELIEAMNEKNGGKPIYAMAADHAFSAAFAIATCADRIYVNRTGGVGSVGIIMLHADMTQALADEGIKVTHIRSGKNKAKGGPYETLDADTLAHLQGQVDETADIFADLVARNLGIAKKTILETEGLDYMGQHAKAIGFVNEVMSEPQAWVELERRIARN